MAVETNNLLSWIITVRSILLSSYLAVQEVGEEHRETSCTARDRV